MRLVIFYLLLLVTQGLLTTLLAPLPAPDLFLLALITLLWRVVPWQLVLIGYAIGLMQDVIGYGDLGVHALGLAGAALAALVVRTQLSQSGFFERLLAVFVALLGKWLILYPLVWWLTGTPLVWWDVIRVAPVEIIFTLLVSIWLLPWADALMERTALLRKELL